MKKINRYHIDKDNMGNIIISNDTDNKTIFFQFESDTEAVEDLLRKNEKINLNDGYTIDIKYNEPRASCIEEYFCIGE